MCLRACVCVRECLRTCVAVRLCRRTYARVGRGGGVAYNILHSKADNMKFAVYSNQNMIVKIHYFRP